MQFWINGLWAQPTKQRLYGTFLLWPGSRMLPQFWFSPRNYFYCNTCKDTAGQESAAVLLKTKCCVKLLQSEVHSIFGSRKWDYFSVLGTSKVGLCSSCSAVKLIWITSLFLVWGFFPEMTVNHVISPVFSGATWVIKPGTVLSLWLKEISQHTAGSLVSLVII